jgi:hypothetical protein
LESVRRQTALQEIGQVVVSENGLAGESEDVCRQFPDLPILYLQQRPPVPILFHLQAIWKHVQHPLVAFLHDDDWWAPEHVERALHALRSNPDCVAAFSNFFETEGPAYPGEVSEKAWRVWVASDRTFLSPVLNLAADSVFLACLLHPSFHYSTFLGDRDAAWDSYRKVAETHNEYDNDRTFPVFLTSHGHIAYLTVPDVYVRMHKGQDSKRDAYRRGGWSPRMIRTTRWMVETWPALFAAAVQKFNATIGSVALDKQMMIASRLGDELREVLMGECGLALPRPAKGVKWFLKQICPPAIWSIGQRLYYMFL